MPASTRPISIEPPGSTGAVYTLRSRKLSFPVWTLATIVIADVLVLIRRSTVYVDPLVASGLGDGYLYLVYDLGCSGGVERDLYSEWTRW